MVNIKDVNRQVVTLAQRQYSEQLELVMTLASSSIPHDGKVFQYDCWVVNEEVVYLEQSEAWSRDTFGQAVGIDNVMTRSPFTGYSRVIRGDLLLQIGTLVYRGDGNLIFEKKREVRFND